MPDPFSIRIFLPGGTPDGLRILSRTNWNGAAVVCPRALLLEHKGREEFSRAGVYVLVGPSEQDALSRLYIGQGDIVRPRLESHFANKDFWTWAVFFTVTDGSLNAAHYRHVEARLIERAHAAKRSHVENAVQPSGANLSAADLADADAFLGALLSLLPLLGVTAFEAPDLARAPVAPPRPHTPTPAPGQTLTIQSNGIVARGVAGPEFVVFKDSQVTPTEQPSMPAGARALRHALIENGVLAKTLRGYVFTQDYAFNSPSQAACVVLGISASGPLNWKGPTGTTMGEIERNAVPLALEFPESA